jgi:hypothetical protein
VSDVFIVDTGERYDRCTTGATARVLEYELKTARNDQRRTRTHDDRPVLPSECSRFHVVFTCIFNDFLLCSTVVSKRRATCQQFTFRPLDTLRCHTTEKGVILDAMFPEVFAFVARIKIEFDRIFVIALDNDRCQ